MSRSSQKKRRLEKECSRSRECMYKGLDMGLEDGVCLEGPEGKLERKNGEDEHEKRNLYIIRGTYIIYKYEAHT